MSEWINSAGVSATPMRLPAVAEVPLEDAIRNVAAALRARNEAQEVSTAAENVLGEREQELRERRRELDAATNRRIKAAMEP